MAKRGLRRWHLYLGALAVIAVWTLVSSALATPAAPAPDGYERAIVLWVSDGDTIFVRTESGEENYCRAASCDCPESVHTDETRNTPEGKEASEFTKGLLPKGTVVYLVRDVSDTDKYGRWIRYVWLEIPDDPWDIEEVRTKMLSGILVDTGHAQAKAYTPDTSYYKLLKKIERSAS